MQIFHRISFFLACCLQLAIASAQTTVPFSLNDQGHILIPASVNGTKGCFVFDTGGGLNLLTKKFADKAGGLERTSHFYTGHRATGEALPLDLWRSESLEIDKFESKAALFTVFDIDFPFDGLISLTSFTETAVTIDFSNNTFSIETKESLEQRRQQSDFLLPLQVTNDRGVVVEISTAVELANRLRLNVRLDSGAGFDSFRFNSRYMKALGIDSADVKQEYRSSYFKPEEGNTFYYSEVSKLEAAEGQVQLNQLQATFIEGLIYEGIVGINWIGEVITIDIPNQRLLVRN